jgi:hypothetical protein
MLTMSFSWYKDKVNSTEGEVGVVEADVNNPIMNSLYMLSQQYLKLQNTQISIAEVE